jgi:hypothetical protein
MRDRAAEILGNYENGLPENELYNRIRPETMPTEGIDILSREAASMKLKDRKEYIEKGLLNGKSLEEATLDDILDAYYSGNPAKRAEAQNWFDEVNERYRDYPNMREAIMRKNKDKFAKTLKKNINKAAEAPSQRGGKAGALDTILSERLGIAPGNTNKRQAKFDLGGNTVGRYRGGAREIAVGDNIKNPENLLSTMAHERLHSFQNEAKATSGRYDNEVNAAYRELQKELMPNLHPMRQIRKDHFSNYGYFSEPIEQEARMLQDYLEAKGYTNSGKTKFEYGEEVHPAFDKFFDKLRDLSKRGVALPAILAALGGGAYMANQEEDENNNGQQI